MQTIVPIWGVKISKLQMGSNPTYENPIVSDSYIPTPMLVRSFNQRQFILFRSPLDQKSRIFSCLHRRVIQQTRIL